MPLANGFDGFSGTAYGASTAITDVIARPQPSAARQSPNAPTAYLSGAPTTSEPTMVMITTIGTTSRVTASWRPRTWWPAAFGTATSIHTAVPSRPNWLALFMVANTAGPIPAKASRRPIPSPDEIAGAMVQPTPMSSAVRAAARRRGSRHQ